MDSLICNVNLGVRVLIMYGGDSPLPPSRNPSRRPRAPASSPTTPGTGPSPFPAIDEFIVSRCNEGGSQGSIRSWVWWQENSLLILNISGNRFCANIGRQHKSNGIYMVVDLQAGVWFQRCYDPECRNFRSVIMPLPPNLRCPLPTPTLMGTTKSEATVGSTWGLCRLPGEGRV